MEGESIERGRRRAPLTGVALLMSIPILALGAVMVASADDEADACREACYSAEDACLASCDGLDDPEACEDRCIEAAEACDVACDG